MVARRASKTASAFSARRSIKASASSAASARRSIVASAAGEADAKSESEPHEADEVEPGEPDRDRARSRPRQPPDGSSEFSLDLDRDRSEPELHETETTRCGVSGDDWGDQLSAAASPCTESQCVGSLSFQLRMGTMTKSFAKTEPSPL